MKRLCFVLIGVAEDTLQSREIQIERKLFF